MAAMDECRLYQFYTPNYSYMVGSDDGIQPLLDNPFSTPYVEE